MRLGLVASLALFFRRASTALTASIAFRVPSMKMLSFSRARGRKGQQQQQQQQQQKQRRRRQQLNHSDAERTAPAHDHDPTHDHSHSEAECTDPTHDHSHSDAQCTDPTHDHSHSDAEATHDHTHSDVHHQQQQKMLLLLQEQQQQLLLQEQQQHAIGAKTDGPVLFEAGALKDWLGPQSTQHSGLLVKRPFCGAWDHLRSDVDKAVLRFGRSAQLETEVKNGEPEELSNRLEAAMASFVAKAGLPAELSKQIHIDACGLGNVVGSMCPFASVLEIKLEVHGENVCSRWHQDWYAGRV